MPAIHEKLQKQGLKAGGKAHQLQGGGAAIGHDVLSMIVDEAIGHVG